MENYQKLFSNLCSIYYITIKKEYQFIYDELLNHLILDCENYIQKNYNPKSDIIEYRKMIFKSEFNKHIQSSQSWFDKIYHPEKCSEIIKRLRKNKLNQIKKLYGSDGMD